MSTRSKYYLVSKQENRANIPKTDVIMKQSHTYGRYVRRSLELFFDHGERAITIRAKERIFNEALKVAKVIRESVDGLHQIIETREEEIANVYEPMEEGLTTVVEKFYVSVIEIVLTKEPTIEQKQSKGYRPYDPMGDERNFMTKEEWEMEKEYKEKKKALLSMRGV